MKFPCFSLLLLSAFAVVKCRVLRVEGIGMKPFLNLNEWEDGLPTGAEMEMTKIIAKKLDYKIIFKLTTGWGRKMPNGSWTGTIGRVKDGHADVGLGHIGLTMDRSHAVRYAHFTGMDSSVIHSAKPGPLPPYLNLIKPFTPELWILFLLSPLLAACFISGLRSNSVLQWLMNALDIFIELVSMVLCQTRAVRFLHKRKFLPFLISWLLFASIMHMAYDCNLRSYLISVEYEQAVDQLEDIEKLGKTLHLLKGSAYTDLFLATKHPVHLRLIPEALKSERFVQLDVGLPLWFDKKMLHEDAVSYLPATWHTNRLKVIKQRFGYIPFRISKSTLLSYYVGLVLSLDDPELFDEFNKDVLYLRDNGVVHKLLNADTLSADDDMQRVDKNVPLGLQHLLFGMVIYVAMIAMALVMFYWEWKSKGNVGRLQ